MNGLKTNSLTRLGGYKTGSVIENMRTVLMVISQKELCHPAGYLKALERGKSVPRPKEFCEAEKVNFYSVLSQNPNCWNLRINDA